MINHPIRNASKSSCFLQVPSGQLYPEKATASEFSVGGQTVSLKSFRFERNIFEKILCDQSRAEKS